MSVGEVMTTPVVRFAGGIVTASESPVMREVMSAVEDVAETTTTVLITGESGTGKEVLARLIHRLSPRAAGPWVAINCAALPRELLENELFGHERGAFTGATERRTGRIEQADGGTLLLDEISELPLSLQAKLLRVLQEREVDRIGGGRPLPVDVRVIATCNRDLAAMVERGEFRADLYYRLNVFPLRLPPLRERREDVALLAEGMLREKARLLGKAAPVISADALEALRHYAFPGNIRELGNLLERALVRCRTSLLDRRALGLVAERGWASDGGAPRSEDENESAAAATPLPSVHLPSLERWAVAEALRRVNGNRTHAARLLGISLRTLRNKLRQYRVDAAAGQELPGTVLPTAAVARSSQLSWAMARGGSR
jgi:two-component system response regulator FlrC